MTVSKANWTVGSGRVDITSVDMESQAAGRISSSRCVLRHGSNDLAQTEEPDSDFSRSRRKHAMNWQDGQSTKPRAWAVPSAGTNFEALAGLGLGAVVVQVGRRTRGSKSCQLECRVVFLRRHLPLTGPRRLGVPMKNTESSPQWPCPLSPQGLGPHARRHAGTTSSKARQPRVSLT